MIETTDPAAEVVTDGLFEGDTGTLAPEARWVLTRVLANRTVSGTTSPALWERLMEHRDVITSRLHDMYLDLHINTHAKVAFKTQIHPDGHDYRVLIPKVTYNREATALLLYLRETYFDRTRSGEGTVRVTRDDLTAEMSQFIQPGERHYTRRQSAMKEAITSLVTQTVLQPVAGNDDLFVISPVIESLLTARDIQHITDWLTRPDLNDAEPPAPAPLADFEEDDEE
jgi:hypothetical protein